MRIPIYKAQSQATSEAPGKSFTARKNVQLAAQTELAKGAPLTAFADEVAKFSLERYKITRNNLLNEADLAADESLMNLKNELEKSPDYNRVLDGDNPLWTERSEAIKNKLLETIGSDKYSQKAFSLRFKQNELKHRNQLRNEIDRRVNLASAGNFSRKLLLGENQLSNWRMSPADTHDVMKSVGVVGNSLVSQTGASQGGVLASVKAMELNGLKSAINAYVSSNPGMAETTLAALQKAIIDGRKGELLAGPPGQQTSLPAPLKGAENLYRRMTRLNDDELAKVWGGAITDLKTVYGFDRKSSKSTTVAMGNTLENTTDIALAAMENGEIINNDDFTALTKSLEIYRNLDGARSTVIDKIETLALYRDLHPQIMKGDVNDLNTILDEVKKGNFRGKKGSLDKKAELNVMDYIEKRIKTVEKLSVDDPLKLSNDSEILADTDLGNLPGQLNSLWKDDGNLDKNAVQQRMMQAEKAKAHWNQPTIKYLTKSEIDNISATWNDERTPAATRLDFIGSIVDGFGPKARDVFMQMGEKGNDELVIMGALINNGQRKDALQIMRGMDRIEAKIGIKEGDVLNGWFRDFTDNSNLANVLEFLDIQAQGAVFNLAKYHYNGYTGGEGRTQGGQIEFVQSDFNRSINAVLGHNPQFNTGGIQKVRDENTLLPIKMDANTALAILDNFSNAMIPLNEMKFRGSNVVDPLPDSLIQDIRTNDSYVLRAAGDGKYFLFEKDRYGGKGVVVRHPGNQENVVIDLMEIIGDRRFMDLKNYDRGYFDSWRGKGRFEE